MSRLQSPSSINLYKQCPRRYYYRYIEKKPSMPNRYTIIGNSVHSVLENFFKINISHINETNYEKELTVFILELMNKEFENTKHQLSKINLLNESSELYDEFNFMINLWIKNFCTRIQIQLSKSKTFAQSFLFIKPNTEIKLISQEHKVQGFVDAIFKRKKGDILVDYKTSKKDIMTEDYITQLSIYALLYYQNYKKLPNKVGVDFLKHGKMHFIDVDQDLLKKAKLECELIKINTQSINIGDYPKKITPLCKWHSGQCDFYDICFK
ncbi:hypothetical protein HOK68_02870 [Candidatus Woesearchaeota archaeon]|jgi:putative RecB family exonuclease|nr:hypothetical protein [Candidatus Woesearchaeota archaeon]MBT4387177.1 hypothetical protein [Candidatus Woesearchaeota archaeon]MBT4596066.1 hypothetical protein [Candidatus Woesearchaeota archaeon]MBT5741468.1 hypothetical protein [Candidatus Woesearchaeota archaeon]MBT6505695.1 hypothetical protein [Candidatus Woesearchaeota archaeon]